jgi:hypothetical protein
MMNAREICRRNLRKLGVDRKGRLRQEDLVVRGRVLD